MLILKLIIGIGIFLLCSIYAVFLIALGVATGLKAYRKKELENN